MRLRTGLVGLLAGLSMAVAGVALAATADTLLVEGFDSENNTLVFGVSPIDDGAIDCTVEGSGYAYVADAVGTVTSLTKNGQPASFKLVGVDVPYGQTSGVCDFTAVDVTGPQGQVNHGQVVSSFVAALKQAGEKRIGCLMRTIAGSDYGKGGETQVLVGETTVVLSGTVDLTAHEASCIGGNSAHESGQRHGNGREGAGNGRPAWAGQGNG